MFGELPTEAILPAAQEALNLLRTTSPELAVHERCGTNLAVAGMLTGLSAMAVAKLRRPYSTANNVIGYGAISPAAYGPASSGSMSYAFATFSSESPING